MTGKYAIKTCKVCGEYDVLTNPCYNCRYKMGKIKKKKQL